jgi:hypothetical protein
MHTRETPLLVQRGGVLYPYGLSFGAWMTWPFGRLAVFSDRFEVNGAKFTANNVASLEGVRSLFCTGLRILHSNPNASKEIIFWSFDFPALQTALEELGFCISGPSAEWRRRQRIGGLLALATWIAIVCSCVLLLVRRIIPAGILSS